jgi:adenylate cyclase
MIRRIPKRKYALAVAVTTLAANTVTVIMFVLFFVPMADSMFHNIYTETMGKISDHNIFLTTIFPYISPIMLVFTYLRPIMKLVKQGEDGRNNADVALRHVINAPIMISLLSLMGWVTAFVIVSFLTLWNMPFYRLHDIVLPVFIQWTNFFIASALCFVISYYTLDVLNQKHFIPQFFADRDLFDVKGAIYLKIRTRLLIFVFAVSFVPIIILLFSIFAYYREPRNLISIMSIMAVYVLAIVYLTHLLTHSFSNPLNEMMKAARQIGRGNYDEWIEIVSCDETGTLSNAINYMSAGLREKDLIKDTFGKIVDPSVRDHLLSGNLNLGGSLLDATILFSDIRNFTGISEKLRPHEVVSMLNRYFEKMSFAVSGEKGLVNKYIGDAIMALFGVPVPLDYQADAAVRCAVKMQRELQLLNSDLSNQKIPKFSIGIGIHTGKVLAGNIGSASRMEYTVIGDDVNIASRVENLTKDYTCGILITESVFPTLKDPSAYQIRFIDKVLVKGRVEQVSIFEVMDHLPAEVLEKRYANRGVYERGVSHFYNQEYSRSREDFQKILATDPTDGAALKFLSRIDEVCNR